MLQCKPCFIASNYKTICTSSMTCQYMSPVDGLSVGAFFQPTGQDTPRVDPKVPCNLPKSSQVLNGHPEIPEVN